MHLLATIGHRDWPACLDSVEEPFLDWIVVQGACSAEMYTRILSNMCSFVGCAMRQCLQRHAVR